MSSPPPDAGHTGPARVVVGDATTAHRHFGAICDLYEATFSQPPFLWAAGDGERQREQLRRLLADPTFAVAVALAGDDLVGFVYGVRVAPDTRRWDGFVTPVPAEVTAEWEGRTFAVLDLAVVGRCRGRGVGRRLLEALLGSRSEERATLSVEPDAEATQGFYRHLGWQEVGRKRMGEGHTIPFFDVYVLPLRPGQNVRR